MKKVFFVAFLILSPFILSATTLYADSIVTAAKDHAQMGDKYLQDGLPFLAIEEYRKAIDRGLVHPDIYRNLGIALYDLGLIDDSIAELKKAEALSDNDLSHMELGILYLAKDQYEQAKEQFFAALDRNPGSANTYYFLGEVFFRTKNYKLARLSAQMAERLGHKGKDLFRKLRDLPQEKELSLWDKNNEELYIRQILVDSEEKAKSLVDRFAKGEMFDDLASSESMALNSTLGGYAGHFKPSELKPKIAKVLVEREPFSDPVIVETKEGFHVVQRIAPFDFDFWKESLEESDKYPAVAGGKTIEPTKQKKRVQFIVHAGSYKKFEESDKYPAVAGGKTIEPTKQKKRVQFTVHAGSYRKKEAAQKRINNLIAIGFPSYCITVENKKTGTWYGVIAGKYDTHKEATEAAAKLSKQGYKHFIYQN